MARRSPARRGAPTSSASGRYVWLLTSRLFFLMGGARPRQLADHLPQADATASTQEAANGAYTIALVAGRARQPRRDRAERPDLRPDRAQAGDLRELRDRLRRGPLVSASRPAVPSPIVGAALFGASAGTFLAVDWALMTDIIPRASSGRYMGLSNVATAASTIVRGDDRRARDRRRQHGARASAPGPRAAFLLGAVYYVVGALDAAAGRRAAARPRPVDGRRLAA